MKIENNELHRSEKLTSRFAPYREEEPLISASQVEKLVSSRSMLLSRSRKSNIRRSIMTISGFAALAALSLLLTRQSEPPIHGKQHSVVEPRALTAPLNSLSREAIGNTQPVNSPNSQALVRNAVKPFRSLNSSEYVWLKKSDFPFWGIEQVGSDGIVFYEKWLLAKFKKIVIKDVGGLYGHTTKSQDINLVDLPTGLNVPSFIPVFVTMGNGTQCFSQYLTDSSSNFTTTFGSVPLQAFKAWLLSAKLWPGLHLSSMEESKIIKDEGLIHRDIITLHIGRDMPKLPMVDQLREKEMAEHPPQMRLIIDSMASYLEGNGPKPSLTALSDSVSMIGDTVTVLSFLTEIDSAVKKAEQLEAKKNGEALANLIPVVVSSDPNHPGVLTAQDFIFWYKPTEDLLKVLDYQQIASVSNTIAQNGAILKTLAFPNPTKGKLSVHVEVGQPSNLNVSVRNLLGQEVAKLESINANGPIDSDLDLSKLAEGIYLIDITTDRGEQSIRRIVIEH